MNENMAGWSMLTFEKLLAWGSLFEQYYKENGGITQAESWSTSLCCVSLAGGYRLTANGRSFVYPLDAESGHLNVRTRHVVQLLAF